MWQRSKSTKRSQSSEEWGYSQSSALAVLTRPRCNVTPRNPRKTLHLLYKVTDRFYDLCHGVKNTCTGWYGAAGAGIASLATDEQRVFLVTCDDLATLT